MAKMGWIKLSWTSNKIWVKMGIVITQKTVRRVGTIAEKEAS